MAKATSSEKTDRCVKFQPSDGKETNCQLLRLSRHDVSFEVCNPDVVLRVSESLRGFQILAHGQCIYSGRAVVRDLVPSGSSLVCAADLDPQGFDPRSISALGQTASLGARFDEFVAEWQKVYQIRPEFKVALADIQAFLLDLRHWVELVEINLRASPAAELPQREEEALDALSRPVIFMLDHLFAKFEASASGLDAAARPPHRSYAQRLLHPIVLCAPFANRTYQKPLGFAGDYEMVNMILRSPRAGASLFAKLLNCWLLQQASATAHRNRLEFLRGRLTQETLRCLRQGRPCRILNLGCGPAGEVQQFLTDGIWADHAQFTLLDCNDETVRFTAQVLGEICQRHGRQTKIEVLKKFVGHVLREGTRGSRDAEKRYDFIYCSGLFDYLEDRTCRRLMEVFWNWTQPGGLVLATNVTPFSPNRSSLDLLLEWHLIYRSAPQFATFAPEGAAPESVRLHSDDTGVNILLEARKPDA